MPRGPAWKLELTAASSSTNCQAMPVCSRCTVCSRKHYHYTGSISQYSLSRRICWPFRCMDSSTWLTDLDKSSCCICIAPTMVSHLHKLPCHKYPNSCCICIVPIVLGHLHKLPCHKYPDRIPRQTTCSLLCRSLVAGKYGVVEQVVELQHLQFHLDTIYIRNKGWDDESPMAPGNDFI